MPETTTPTVHHVMFYWDEEDEPPYPPPLGWMPNQPFLEQRLFAIPKVGEFISVELPQYEQTETAVFRQPTVIAHGEVLRVRSEGQVQGVILKRQGRVGLSWAELCICIGVPMVGFHPDVGRVEGELIGLLPRAELAQLKVVELTALRDAVLKQHNLTLDEDDDPAPLVWVAWSSLWTKQGLDLMRERAATSSPPATRRRK